MQRHETYRGDPRSVGNLGASKEDNARGEAELLKTVRQAAALLAGRTVLDLGCGYRRFAGEFLASGYEYHGLDVSPDAIAAAQIRHPGADFSVQDLNAWEPKGVYDIVCALYLLVHFVKDADWARLLRMSSRALGENGVLVIADVFPAERSQPVQHVVSRTIAEYSELTASFGLVWDEDLGARFSEACGPRDPYARHFRFLRKG